MANTEYQLASLRFVPATGELIGAGGTCKLEPKVANVLTALFRERGALVPRQHLLDECWGEGEGSDEALTQAIAQIRRALEALRAPRDLLITYPKRGYRLSTGESVANDPQRRGHPWRAGLALATIGIPVILLLIVLAAKPGWPRHMIRHTLGLGPHQM